MTLLQALRNATHASHQQLDRQISTEEVTASRESYARYLKLFHQGLSACWTQLDWELLERLKLPDLPARQARYHALTADLHALGHPAPPLEQGLDRDRPAATTVGCLYVLEGSIHGGAILLAELERKSGPLPTNTCGFMRGFGDQNRPFWKEFVAWLESFEPEADFLESASASAVDAFDQFTAAFRHSSPAPSSSPAVSQ